MYPTLLCWLAAGFLSRYSSGVAQRRAHEREGAEDTRSSGPWAVVASAARRITELSAVSEKEYAARASQVEEYEQMLKNFRRGCAPRAEGPPTRGRRSSSQRLQNQLTRKGAEQLLAMLRADGFLGDAPRLSKSCPQVAQQLPQSCSGI